MTRFEASVIGIVVGLLLPVSFFILFGVIAIALKISHILEIAETFIIIIAFIGLSLAIILNIIYLKKWVTIFYIINMKLLIMIYLLLSILAIVIFIGFPFGNIALGTVAGIYMGRKLYHNEVDGMTYRKRARKVGFFTSLVTSIESVPIGLLALHEPILADTLCEVAGLEQSVTSGPIGIALVILACMILLVFQFWCTRTATAWAFRLGRKVT